MKKKKHTSLCICYCAQERNERVGNLLYATGSLTYEVISNAIPRHHSVTAGNGSVSIRRAHAVGGQLGLFNFRPGDRAKVFREKKRKGVISESGPDKLFMKDNKLRRRRRDPVPELFCHFLRGEKQEQNGGRQKRVKKVVPA